MSRDYSKFEKCLQSRIPTDAIDELSKIKQLEIVNQKSFISDLLEFFKGQQPDKFLSYVENITIEEIDFIESRLLSPILECLISDSEIPTEEKIVLLKKLKKVFHELLIDRFFNLFQQAEETLISLFDNINEIVYIHDIKGKIIFINSAGTKILGEVKSLWEVVSKDYKDFLKESYERFARKEMTIFIDKVEITSKEGKKIYLEVKSVPIYRSGHIVAFQGIARDITDSVKLEQQIAGNLNIVEEQIKKKLKELEEANKKLKEINELKDTVLSQIAHELRTPLVPIKGYIDLLLMEKLGTLNDKQKKALGVISRELSRFKRLIDSLFLQTSLHSGRISINLETFDLKEIINEILEKLRDEAEKKDVNFITNITASSVVGDKTKIEEVLYNLIDNSIKFNKNGGSIRINIHREGREIAVEISDTGIGIPQEDINIIFEKYSRGSNISKSKRGLGLGLFIVKRILQIHGSRFTIESTPGKGTTFKFYLPSGEISHRT